MVILCGWCERPTNDRPVCDHCRHQDPRRPWEQRALPVPDAAEARRKRLREAEAALRSEGVEPTAERLAERLGVDPRTVRRWQQVSA